jgi:Ca2+-binding EF-hand superfamily protein
MRDIAKRKELAELAVIEGQALDIMRYHQREEKLSKESLFDLFDADKDGKISETEFVKFFESCKRPPKAKAEKKEGEGEADGDEDGLEPAPKPEGLSKVFKSLDEDDEGFLSKGRFGIIMISVMKVVAEAKLSKEVAADSDAVRQLDKGEVVEVVEAPVEEGKFKRAKVVAIKDGAEGYVTVSDDAGAVFLREGGKMFKVVKETIMTEGFDLEDDAPKEQAPEKKTATRKLKVGELVEVREYPKKEEKSGLTRMKCKAKTDGRLGWATTLGNAGAVFLEVA